MYSWNQNKTPYYTSALKTDGRTRRHGGLDCVSWFVRSTQGYSRWANQESAKTSPAVADGEGGRDKVAGAAEDVASFISNRRLSTSGRD